MHQDVSYIPKRDKGSREPWVAFGAGRAEYEKWAPHICGICCLKMVGDTLQRTVPLSLYDLTMQCVEKGGFREQENGTIEGVFHYPLATLAQSLGIAARVERHIREEYIVKAVSHGEFVILSIDLTRVAPPQEGSHLILIHGYDPEHDVFLIHDCSSVVSADGRNISLSRIALAQLSNRKGLVLA